MTANYFKSVSTTLSAGLRRKYALQPKTIISAPNRTGKTLIIRELLIDAAGTGRWHDEDVAEFPQVLFADTSLFPASSKSPLLREAIMKRFLPEGNVTPSSLPPEQQRIWDQLVAETDEPLTMDFIPKALRRLQTRLTRACTDCEREALRLETQYDAALRVGQQAESSYVEAMAQAPNADKDATNVAKFGPTIRWLAENDPDAALDTAAQAADAKLYGLLKDKLALFQQMLRFMQSYGELPLVTLLSPRAADVAFMTSVVEDCMAELDKCGARLQSAGTLPAGGLSTLPDDFNTLAHLTAAEQRLGTLKRAQIARDMATAATTQLRDALAEAHEKSLAARLHRDAGKSLSQRLDKTYKGVMQRLCETVEAAVDAHMPAGLKCKISLSGTGASWEIVGPFGQTPWSSCAGSERAALMLAVTLAWHTQSSSAVPPVLCLDDECLASMDNATFVEVANHLSAQVDSGILGQIVMATWRDVDPSMLEASDWLILNPSSGVVC